MCLSFAFIKPTCILKHLFQKQDPEVNAERVTVVIEKLASVSIVHTSPSSDCMAQGMSSDFQVVVIVSWGNLSTNK